jgi:uncharacterized protein (DUF433 family)
MAIVDVGRHLVIDPEMVHGRLTFKGTRVPVATILVFLAEGESIDDLVRKFPQLSREAIAEAIRLASEALHDRYEDDLRAAQELARRRRDGVVEAQPGVAGA